MSRGIMTVGEDMTFDEIDALGQIPGMVTDYSQLNTQSAVAPSPVSTMATAPAATPSILNSITSILSSGAQAYGAYSTARASKKPGQVVPMAYPQGYSPSVAPTSAGLSGTQIALIVGGGVLLLGVATMLVLRK